MEEYPRNINELDTRFRTEGACRDYVMRLRWPDGLKQSRCVETSETT